MHIIMYTTVYSFAPLAQYFTTYTIQATCLVYHNVFIIGLTMLAHTKCINNNTCETLVSFDDLQVGVTNTSTGDSHQGLSSTWSWSGVVLLIDQT